MWYFTHWKFLFRSVFLLPFVFHLSLAQKSYSQKAPKEKPITLHIKNQPIKKVFDEITKQAGVYFMGSQNDFNMNEPVTIDVDSEKLEIILHKLISPQNYKVTIDRNTVIIERNVQPIDIREQHTLIDTGSNVTGYVYNENGNALGGVTVMIKGSNLGVTTGGNGFFKILAKGNATLLITSVGYVNREVPVSKRKSLGTIKLKEYVSNLDETIIVAYGQTTKRLNIGNVTRITSEEIRKQPVNNPLYALQGRVPGLIITPRSGLAGGIVDIQIRGRNSLSQLSEPLIVIDGLPVANTIKGLGHTAINNMSFLNFINPNDIESIEVLKDANATSIYGSRGANGVILITTKKGKKGDAKIDINIQNGISNVSRKVDLLSTDKYLNLRREAYQNSGIDFVNTFPFGIPGFKYEAAPDLFIWDQNRYTDWQKKLIGNNASFRDIQTTISGGSEQISYLIGGNLHRETTVFPGNNDDVKHGAHFSLTGTSRNQKFRASILTSYNHDNNTLPSVDLTFSATTLPPNAPEIFRSDGMLNYEPSPTGLSSWDNPYSSLYQTYNAITDNIIANIDLSYRLANGLSIRAQGGLAKLFGKSFRKVYPFLGRKPEEINNTASSGFNRNEVSSFSFEPQMTYKFRMLEGDIQILSGLSMQSSNGLTEQINASGYTSDALLKNWASATSRIIFNSSSEYKYAAVFGRVSYNFRNKYLLNATIRRDGSSRFGPKNRYGTFASIGGGWIFTEESFIDKGKSIISFGKIRASYGSSGNDGIGDYQYLERYAPLVSQIPYDGSIGYVSQGLVNPYYAWEVTKKLELGLELGTFQDKVFLTASYFRNRSNNQLSSYPYPSYVGPGYVYTNIPATVQNSGLELTINSDNLKSKTLKWNTSINFTITRNKLVSFPDIAGSAYYQKQIGKPFYGVGWVYDYAGVDATTGKLQFRNSEGKLVDNPEDFTREDGGRIIEVNTLPKFYGGISNSISFKGIQLDVLFQFRKQKTANPFNYLLSAGTFYTNLPSSIENRWRKEGDVSEFPKLYGDLTDPTYEQSINTLNLSDWSVVDASFIRLKNLSLSYSIPEKVLGKMHSSLIRFFVQGQNLWTYTKYKGLDVETESNTSLPPLRTLTMGIQATF